MQIQQKDLYANIIVEISHEKVDRTFQYKIRDELKDCIYVGQKVSIPFGKGNKLIQGYVMEITDVAEFDTNRMKEIHDIVRDGISIESRWIKIAYQLKRSYGSTMIAAMKTVLPVKRSVKPIEKRTLYLNIEKDKARALYRQFEEKHQKAKARLLFELMEYDFLPYSLVTGKLSVSAKTIQGMEQKGIIRIESVSEYRNPISIADNRKIRKQLNEEQKHIFDTFVNHYEQGERKQYLLHGVTGSGKTEVYIEMIDYVLSKGKQAIVLIPEIALSFQTLNRFYQRFGDVVSVMNSKLSQGEKYDQFMRAKNGEVKIMIGPRSALFTPFPDLGIVVMDEEHESSYKSETMPKFHAREVAAWIAENTNSPLVLGSATPSLDTYYKVQKGSIHLFQLAKRYSDSRLPNVEVVDLRNELREGNRSVFSRSLAEKISERLERKEQIMLFLNRRGYAGFISCRSCGHVMKCPHCDVSLTDHKNGKLICHYCGYETNHVTNCPKCGSKYILGFKAGTQQIEELIGKQFPNARVLRMDGDTTKKKDDYEKILAAFTNEEADILIGTQMIVKGHDFKKVTLVGILAADLSLGANDYRASERTFQLLTQAAGRAGRGEIPGDVVIQTYQPEHYAIQHAKNQDYIGFYNEEIAYRKIAGYPPISHLLAVLIQSKKEEDATLLAKEMSDYVRQLARSDMSKRIVVIGPAKATIGKINDTYRQILYVKNADYENLIYVKDKIENYMEKKKERFKYVLTFFDFDPMSGY